MERVSAFSAEFRFFTIFGLAIWALRQHCPPTKLKSMTAGQECQELSNYTK
jgi:hypothetical protein